MMDMLMSAPGIGGYVQSFIGGALLIGGTLVYFYVEGLQTEIKNNQTTIANLRTLNEGLAEENRAQMESAANIREEIAALRALDEVKEKRIKALSDNISSLERRNRLDRNMVRDPSLMTFAINRSAKCQLENFDRFDGKCVGSRFVEDKDND